jgi:hypothetical protein
MAEADERFNVYFIYPDGTHTREREWVPAEEAVAFAHQASTRPAAKLGILKEIMITDSGDFCVFQWKHGEGVVFPPQTQQADQ